MRVSFGPLSVFLWCLLAPFGAGAQVLPDLVPVTVEGPRAASRGETITVGVGVRNAGRSNAPGSWRIMILLSKDTVISTTDVMIGTTQYPSTLSVGALGGRTLSVVIPQTLDSAMWYIGAILDPDSRVSELVETNNARAGTAQIAIPASAALPPPLPDFYPLNLKVRSVSPNLYAGEGATGEVDVRNVGAAPSGPWTAELALVGMDSRIVLTTLSGTSIAPGGSMLKEFTFTFPSTLAPGTYIEFQLDVDPANLVREVGEPETSNNRTVLRPVTILKR